MALELDAVTVAVGRARLIADVSLSVTPGKLTIVLGANGAGKSTALAALAGDIRPAQGEARLDGVPLPAIAPRQLASRRAVVLQHAPLNFALQVHEVIALSRTTLGLRGDAADEIEERALGVLGLVPLAARDYSTLSGGERQRVQIARALAQLWHHADGGVPGYLLMDEPTAYLDLKHQIIALEAARSFADVGGGALCILHDLALAREFSDEVALMSAGRIAARGEACTLLTAPRIAEIFDVPEQRAERLAVL
jgi:iron complex transport system ATP-binding protein